MVKKIRINESNIRSMVRGALMEVFNEWRSYDQFGERDDDEEDEDDEDGNYRHGLESDEIYVTDGHGGLSTRKVDWR